MNEFGADDFNVTVIITDERHGEEQVIRGVVSDFSIMHEGPSIERVGGLVGDETSIVRSPKQETMAFECRLYNPTITSIDLDKRDSVVDIDDNVDVVESVSLDDDETSVLDTLEKIRSKIDGRGKS